MSNETLSSAAARWRKIHPDARSDVLIVMVTNDYGDSLEESVLHNLGPDEVVALRVAIAVLEAAAREQPKETP